MTLLELIVAMAVMLLVVGTLAGLAKGVQLAFEHGEAYGTATQHARVALERITRTANEAKANRHFPGFLVVEEYDGSWRFPETLVVWRRATPPSDTDLPRVNELVVYCPERGQPSVLLELTSSSDATQMPSLDPTGSSYTANLTSWRQKVLNIRTSTTATKVRITSLVRTAMIPGHGLRGVVRFERRLMPTDAQLNPYYTAPPTQTWQQLKDYWVQGFYGPEYGLRQAWLRIELQLKPETNLDVKDASGLYPVPFFGSAAIYYLMHP